MTELTEIKQRQKWTEPEVNYFNLRWNNIASDEFKHLIYLIFWPVFGILFTFLERYHKVDYYYPVHCALDDVIPFNELFLIPYMFWFAYIAIMIIYTLLYDTESFKKMMNFIILTYTVTIIIYFIFPNCQELRPTEFERDNFLTRFMADFYRFDTNTNVCPSIHVIGSLAVMFTSFHSKGIKKGVKAVSGVTAMLICVSTVFLKQHSVIDVFAALPLCALAYWLFFLKKKHKNVI